MGMIAKPTAGAIADRYRSQKVIFLIMQLVTAFGFLSIFYVPEVQLERIVHFSCDRNEAVFDNCIHIKMDESPTVNFKINKTSLCKVSLFELVFFKFFSSVLYNLL